MIIVKKTDNIFDIIYKIKQYNSEDKNIIINFPFWHNVLYNKVALQSIKDSSNKKIIISTNDILSKKIWKNIGVKYHIIKDSKFELGKDLLKYNYSFYEYFIYEIKKIINNFYNIFFKNRKIIDPRKNFLKYYKQKSHLPIFITILTLTIFIFSYIFIFALNKTYVYITPNVQVKTKAQNFIFDSNNKIWNNSIALKIFSKKIDLEKIINTTWIIQNNRHKARWTVIFYNKLETEIKLLPKTRLESKNGIIYETISYLKIPGSKKNKNWTLLPWTKQINIIARIKDKYWNPIWERWNIDKVDTILTIPWLKIENRINIFAKTTTKIKWWKNIFEKVVSEKDLENTKKFLIESLKKEAIKQIIKEVNKDNNESNIEYKVLPIDDIYKYSNLNLKLPEIKPWDKINQFKVYWDIEIKTYAFNINSVTSKLKNSIEKNLLPEKEKLLYINNKSITIFPEKGILYRREKPLKIKATLEIEYNVEYNFWKENDNYISRLKQTIAWLQKEKAETILINENLISNATIEIRPFFVDNVSKYLNNIEFITK